MFGMCWSRQTLGESVSNHEIGAKRNEFENLLCDQVTHKVARGNRANNTLIKIHRSGCAINEEAPNLSTYVLAHTIKLTGFVFRWLLGERW